jgi:hypothetical protein
VRREKPSDYTIEYLRSRITVNENGCWETGANPPLASLGGRYIKMARVSLALVDPNFDINNPKIYACHKCDNNMCINPDHLFAGTASDNQQDFWDKVKSGRRFRNHSAKPFRVPPHCISVGQ